MFVFYYRAGVKRTTLKITGVPQSTQEEIASENELSIVPHVLVMECEQSPTSQNDITRLSRSPLKTSHGVRPARLALIKMPRRSKENDSRFRYT